MRRTVLLAAAAMALLPVVAMPQAAPEPASRAPASGTMAASPPTASARLFPAPLTANDLIGGRVVTPDGDDVATIADLLLDENGVLRQVVLDVGGFLGIASKPVAIDVGRLRPPRQQPDAFVLGMSKDELAALPAGDAQRWRGRTS
jgi:PRC-barrel domain